MSHKKQRSAFDQVSELDRERIVAYRDCGLFFRKIGSRVGRNQTTVMRICDRWMQQGTTDRRGRSHPPQCTTSHEEKSIVRMAMTDRSITSRTVAQHIKSVTHHSVSARTIQCRLQQSGLFVRRPLLGLPLTQNHRRLRRHWCSERRMLAVEWNEVAFSDESRICLHHHDGRIRVWRHRGERMLNSCVMHRHTGPASGIIIWGGVGCYSCTSLICIAGSLNSQRYISKVLKPVVLPYLQGLATAIFQQDNARPYVAQIVQRFFGNNQEVINQHHSVTWRIIIHEYDVKTDITSKQAIIRLKNFVSVSLSTHRPRVKEMEVCAAVTHDACPYHYSP
ncbi:transposable element Tcb1 transposase [Trichonephila clavipes]|nr:transposable element Tcb1 transposase [Trichonephila clavipes]